MEDAQTTSVVPTQTVPAMHKHVADKDGFLGVLVTLLNIFLAGTNPVTAMIYILFPNPNPEQTVAKISAFLTTAIIGIIWFGVRANIMSNRIRVKRSCDECREHSAENYRNSLIAIVVIVGSVLIQLDYYFIFRK